MNDKPYEKECLFCKEKIRMSKETGKWLPYSLDNGPHECRKKEKQEATETLKQIVDVTNQKQNNHKEITLEMVLAKLKSIGINVNLDELFKESNYIQ